MRKERQEHCLGLLACKCWKPTSKPPGGLCGVSPAPIPPFRSDSPVWFWEGKVGGPHPSPHSVPAVQVGLHGSSRLKNRIWAYANWLNIPPDATG